MSKSKFSIADIASLPTHDDIDLPTPAEIERAERVAKEVGFTGKEASSEAKRAAPQLIATSLAIGLIPPPAGW